jgi:hypothetical protein
MDSNRRDYYYYPDNKTKIEVTYFETDGELQKKTKTYYLQSYASNIADKIRERQKWNKFGEAINQNQQQQQITTICDEVFLEITAKYVYYKKPENKNNLSPDIVLNKIYYCDEQTNQKETEIQSESENQSKNQKDIQQKYDSDCIYITPIENETKKSLVNCRYCNKNTHWSIQCPILIQKKKEDELQKEKEEKEEKEEKDKEYREKRRNEQSIIGIKVSELDESLTEQEIRNHFSQFGKISNMFLIRSKKTNKFIGSVYITYSTQEENDNALEIIKTKPLNYIIPFVEKALPKKY